jgi:hypothetical protein
MFMICSCRRARHAPQAPEVLGEFAQLELAAAKEAFQRMRASETAKDFDDKLVRRVRVAELARCGGSDLRRELRADRQAEVGHRDGQGPVTGHSHQ